MDQWDPIGVKEYPEAADEYDGYIGGVYGLLSRGATDQELADHLSKIETEHMGLSRQANQSRLLAVALVLREVVERVEQNRVKPD
jgi:hypothetical protein